MEALWTLPELVAEVAARIAALPAPKNGQVRAVPDERTVRYYVTLGLLDRPGAMRGRTALYGQKHVAQVVAIKRLQALGRSLSEIQALWPTLDDPTLARMSGVDLPVTSRPTARAAFWKREPVPREAAPAGAGGGIETAGREAARAGAGGGIETETETNSETNSETDTDAHQLAATAGGASSRASSASSASSASTASSAPRAPSASSPGAGGSTLVPGRGGTARAPGAVELRIELAPQVVLSLSITDESVVISPADVRALRAAAAPLLAELASRRFASHAEGEDA